MEDVLGLIGIPPKNPQERPESPSGPLGADGGRPGVDFPSIFIQIRGNLADLKPKSLPEGPGWCQKVLRPPCSSSTLLRVPAEKNMDGSF